MCQSGVLGHVSIRTHKVKVHVVFKQVMTANDVRMLEQAEKEGLGWQGSSPRILHPRVVRDFVLDDEFDRDLMSPEAMRGRHDEAITACPKLVAQMVPTRELRVQDVVTRKTR